MHAQPPAPGFSTHAPSVVRYTLFIFPSRIFEANTPEVLGNLKSTMFRADVPHVAALRTVPGARRAKSCEVGLPVLISPLFFTPVELGHVELSGGKIFEF